jgi:hypothetical protein
MENLTLVSYVPIFQPHLLLVHTLHWASIFIAGAFPLFPTSITIEYDVKFYVSSIVMLCVGEMAIWNVTHMVE